MRQLRTDHLAEEAKCLACNSFITKVFIMETLTPTRDEPGEAVAVCPECGAIESWESLPASDECDDDESAITVTEIEIADLKAENALLRLQIQKASQDAAKQIAAASMALATLHGHLEQVKRELDAMQADELYQYGRKMNCTNIGRNHG